MAGWPLFVYPDFATNQIGQAEPRLHPFRGASSRPDSTGVQFIATIVGESFVAVESSIGADTTEAHVLQFLRDAALSIRALPDLPADKAPLTDEQIMERATELLQRGVTLKQSLLMAQLVPGVRWSALLNDSLASKTDRALPGIVVLTNDELIRHVGLYLAINTWEPTSNDTVSFTAFQRLGAAHARGLQTFVFDGRSAHAIMLVPFEFTHEQVVYWEPWGEGTFLSPPHNRAEITATPHPKFERYFILSTKDLHTVLYSAQMPEQQMAWLLRAMQTFAAPPEDALRAARLKDSGLSRRDLLIRAGKYFLSVNDRLRATNAFVICRALHNESAEVSAGLAELASIANNGEEAKRLYSKAITQLTTSPLTERLDRLEARYRQRLADLQQTR